MFDLPPLALQFVQRLVIRHLKHDRCNFLAELVLEFAECCFCVFEGVVKDGCDQYLCITDACLVSQDVSECYWVIDIGRFIDVLSSLVSVFVGRECNRFYESILRFDRLFHKLPGYYVLRIMQNH